MPTGYTAPIYEGKDITFREFALRCSRNMMTLASMRDHGLDAEIPAKLVPDDYHEKQITEWHAALVAAESMTDEEAERAASKEYADEVRRRAESIAERAERRRRCEAMLARVETWAPPSKEHEGLKSFMLEQLRESLRFDCAEFAWPEPKRQTGAEYRADSIACARERIARHEAELADERRRCDGANAWLAALRASLPSVDAR